MFTTGTLGRQAGRITRRCVSTTRYNVYNQRRTTVAAAGLGACAGAWWYTSHANTPIDDSATNANEAAIKIDRPLVVHQIVGNQPAAARTKEVEADQKLSIAIANRTEKVTPVKPVVATADLASEDAAQSVSTPKRLVGGNYTAAKKHVDDEEDEKWFTC